MFYLLYHPFILFLQELLFDAGLYRDQFAKFFNGANNADPAATSASASASASAPSTESRVGLAEFARFLREEQGETAAATSEDRVAKKMVDYLQVGMASGMALSNNLQVS